MNFEQFFEFILSEQCFNVCNVSVIDSEHRIQYVEQDNYWVYYGKISALIAEKNTLKIEMYEKIVDYNEGTMHIFYNPIDGPSFEEHTDPVDVVIYCCDGNKILEIEGSTKLLNPGEQVEIPKGTKHRALNTQEALIFSYGISDTKIYLRVCEDNGNLQS